MLLTIMRHGEAQPSAGSDAARTLTQNGRRDVVAGARRLLQRCEARDLPPPQWLAHSPYVRTTQTAALVGDALGLTPEPLTQLAPGYSAAELEQALSAHQEQLPDHVLLVSHQPLVSLLVMRWLGEASPRYALTPGGFTTLTTDIILPDMATHTFSALPPDYEVVL